LTGMPKTKVQEDLIMKMARSAQKIENIKLRADWHIMKQMKI